MVYQSRPYYSIFIWSISELFVPFKKDINNGSLLGKSSVFISATNTLQTLLRLLGFSYSLKNLNCVNKILYVLRKTITKNDCQTYKTTFGGSISCYSCNLLTCSLINIITLCLKLINLITLYLIKQPNNYLINMHHMLIYMNH